MKRRNIAGVGTRLDHNDRARCALRVQGLSAVIALWAAVGCFAEDSQTTGNPVTPSDAAVSATFTATSPGPHPTHGTGNPDAAGTHRIVCGDGVMEGEENCDDDNRDDGDGCSRFCHEEICGNGTLEVGEGCEPPSTDKCDALCHKLSEIPNQVVCGDFEKEGMEECDDGNTVDGDGCDGHCGSECGNNQIDGNERCDDGNRADNDGCEGNCGSLFQYACGNNQVDQIAGNPQLGADEECDDGNLMAGDGCSGICTQEAVCGDHAVTGSEDCDPPVDGFCSALCKTVHRCGNGVKTGNEECDDGNTVPNDGCTSCHIDGVCGNGVLDWDEQCDGALGIQPGGYCDPDRCVRVGGPGCGNGLLEEGEECDDGNNANHDGCEGNCVAEVCGNADLDPGEWCDDGVSCFLENRCGDGSLSVNEACDDGNTTSGDGCSETCTPEGLCGDGVVGEDEDCDDGNVNAGDGCSDECENEAACGNGTLEAPEQCDDGNVLNGDGCSSRCRIVTAVATGSVGATDSAATTASASTSTTSAVGGCTNFGFDSDASCWAAGDANAIAVWDAADASGDANSGGLSVTFTYTSPGSNTLGTGGASNCITLPANSAYDFAVQYLIGSAEPNGIQAFAGLLEYSGAGCTGGITHATLNYGGTRGSWAELKTSLVTKPTTVSMQLRLYVTKKYSDPAATVKYDDVVLTAGEGGPDVTPPPPGCGDGVLQASEQCDDGNTVAADGCSATCTNDLVCGDGVVSAGEDCEDNNFHNGDGCSSSCKRESRCGDGIIHGVEQCDDGNDENDDGCTNACRSTSARCGDGVKQTGEACDSGLTCDGSCTATCTLPPVCGDGVISGAEECDDGNATDSDGCSASCFVETCGDGIHQSPAEQCDDYVASARCTATVGDTAGCKLIDPLNDGCGVCEELLCQPAADSCDGLTGVMTSGASSGVPRATVCREIATCALEYACVGEACYCGVSEGTGTEETEYCSVPHGPCQLWIEHGASSEEPQTVLEAFRDPTTPVVAAMGLKDCLANKCDRACSGSCGNGRREGDEQCDTTALRPVGSVLPPFVPYCEDGSQSCGNYCTQECDLTVCGDGVRQELTEECDGELDCDATCHRIHGICGDGVINLADSENCETNDGLSDNCDATCCRLHATCGNGVVEEGCPGEVEQCDDGNTDDTDSCKNNCQPNAATPCEQCLVTKCFAYEGYDAFGGIGPYSLFNACHNGRELPTYKHEDGSVFTAAEVAEQCMDVLDCLNTPDGEGRLPMNYVAEALELPFIGLEIELASTEWISAQSGGYNFDDAHGPCKDVMYAGFGRQTDVVLTMLFQTFDYLHFPTGVAGMLADCEVRKCPTECGVMDYDTQKAAHTVAQ